ncbi:M-phase inducer phosphatase 3 isoform X2 [Malaclemys terrapin pileata]|uniref:M-phase inducer phosphatase 3 isoform X2 n=1 Tax=Malaclemys terrapin pileata TaxID=2991368 RepID=UPI0023A7DF2C|nr:M-phase inducer phosphatase 3 isoform X2 [Malaclemys terrapin pileata]
MAGNLSPGGAGGPRSRLGFRASCRMVLNLLRDTEVSLPFTPELPRTPVTALARGLRNLSALAGDTPKCCLDLSDLSSGEEMPAFNFTHSPDMAVAGQVDSSGPQDGLEAQRQNVKSFLPQVLCSTPSSPGSMQREGNKIDNSLNMENEGRWFKHPGWQMPRSLLFRKRATAQLDAGGLEECEVKDLGSPIAAVAPHPCRMAENLDSFEELFPNEQEDMEKPVAGNLSSSMAVLLSGPLLTQDINVSEISINRSRLYRSPSMPEKLDRPVLKRIVRCQDNETPVKVKLRRNPVYEELEQGATLKKAASLSDMEIVKVLDQDYGFRQLIGDFSKVAALLFGQFQSLIETFYIIDCRYPYEYRGGHIKGALNFHRQEEVFEFLLKKPLFPSTPQKRIVLVFHCEFSSERGPKMCRYLRAEDRAMNEYPALHYPELYVLKGGYKEFFPEYKELCEPQDYCPMHHQDYKAELLKFRTKSKLWAGDRRRRDQIARLMKL